MVMRTLAKRFFQLEAGRDETWNRLEFEGVRINFVATQRFVQTGILSLWAELTFERDSVWFPDRVPLRMHLRADAKKRDGRIVDVESPYEWGFTDYWPNELTKSWWERFALHCFEYWLRES